MNLILKRTLKIVSAVLMVIVLILAMLLVGVKLFGIDVLAITSPSMEPKYPTGSLIYISDVDKVSDLKIGDVITYKIGDDTTATHRIKEIIPDENDPKILRFRTKGDNNDTYDGKLVEFENVRGKVVFCIPLLGYLAMYMQTRAGSIVAIAVALAVITFVMIVDIITDDNDKKRKNKSEKGEENEKA